MENFEDFEIRVEPLTTKNWGKLLEVFGEKGACANCWCMYFRSNDDDFREGKFNDGNKSKLRSLVDSSNPVGLLCFLNDIPIGWCSLAPRESFIRLTKSRIHKPVDNQKVWSVPCMFIKKDYRRFGVSVIFLYKLIEHAKNSDISIIEAYPTIIKKDKIPDFFLWTGIYKSFEKVGFKIENGKSLSRPLMRYYVT